MAGHWAQPGCPTTGTAPHPVPSPPPAPPLPHFGESRALWTCSPGGVVCTSSYLPSPSRWPLRLCSAGPLFLQPHLSVPLGNNKGHNPAPNLGLLPSTGAPGCLLLRTQPTASFPPGHLPWATSPSWTAPPLWSRPVFLFLCNPHWIRAQKDPDGTDLIHQIPMAWDTQLMTDKYWPSERGNKSFSTILGTSCCNLRKQVMPLKNPTVTDCLMMH